MVLHCAYSERRVFSYYTQLKYMWMCGFLVCFILLAAHFRTRRRFFVWSVQEDYADVANFITKHLNPSYVRCFGHCDNQHLAFTLTRYWFSQSTLSSAKLYGISRASNRHQLVLPVLHKKCIGTLNVFAGPPPVGAFGSTAEFQFYVPFQVVWGEHWPS